ncbi:MAG: ornithine aminomutase subunit alpha [Candidatus Izemoplasmatales bacterium]|jgi:D-ornithine 4,5-aminomutase subunit alpha
MKKSLTRIDDFTARREHLASMTELELKQYFWDLAERCVQPMVALASTHTSPAIERSVLLRMGFSSIEAKTLVDKTIQYQLMGKGAGHVVFRLSRIKKVSIREAGLQLIKDEGWEDVRQSFEVRS